MERSFTSAISVEPSSRKHPYQGRYSILTYAQELPALVFHHHFLVVIGFFFSQVLFF